LSASPNVLDADPEPPLHRAAAHHKGLHAASTEQVTAIGRIDADHQSALAAHRNGHVPADEEGRSAEHAQFGEALLAIEELSQTISKLFVEGHDREDPIAIRRDAERNGRWSRAV
jgi:hypothetical protein